MALRKFRFGLDVGDNFERNEFVGLVRRADSSGFSVVTGPDHVGSRLAAVLPMRGVVRKKRLLFLVGRTRIHLDEVEGLGSYMELEIVLAEGDDQDGGEREAANLMQSLGITSGDLVSGAYFDLLEEKKGPS